MDFFSLITLLGGLALFLYGMNVMSDGLAKISGGKMEQILENLDASRYIGRCPEQVTEFLSGCVKPVLERYHDDLSSAQAELKV